jgi:glucose/arabinose dehydrogenase
MNFGLPHRTTRLLIGTLLPAALCLPAQAQDPEEPRVGSVQSHLLAPGRTPFDEKLLERLQLPQGFRVNVFAKDLQNPRMLTVGESGTVYVTIRDEDKVIALRDTNGDGQADENQTLVEGLDMVHGIAVRDDRLYLCTPTELYQVTFQAGEPGSPEIIFDDLPDGGQHPNRTIRFDNEGALYISVGSSCNACEESNPEHATLLKADLSARTRSIFARGLRNTVGFDFHPETGQLWGMDHGSDHRGNDIPPEELNRIVEGKHYGWPFAYGDREPDPMIPSEPDDMPLADFLAMSEPMVMGYQAHSAPMGMTFYRGGHFPAEYHGDAFIALRGSWNREPATGYKVVRLRFENGEPKEFSDFMTGFLLEDGKHHFARLCGIATAQDGSLLVADDSNGVIYRITHEAAAKTE